MPDWLLGRPAIITLAIIGGVFSLLASWCRSRGAISDQSISRLNQAAYFFMIGSIILFVSVGLFGTRS